MYFRMNDRSSWWTWAGVSCGNTIVLISVSPCGCGGGLLGLPVVEVLRRVHGDRALHAVMAQSAQLRTRDLVIARLCCREPHRDLHPRHSILLQAEVRQEERVDHVFR